MESKQFWPYLPNPFSVLRWWVLLFLPGMLVSQTFEKRTFRSSLGELPYRLLLPDNYHPEKTYPLLIFLHGAGERGTDNTLQLTHGASLFVTEENRKDFSVIVAFLQCPKDLYWATINSRNPFRFYKYRRSNPQLDLVEQWINWLEKNLPVAQHQVYLGGLSMGGMGTLELLARNPKKFAAAFSICGGGHPKRARKLKHTPLWLFHGEVDAVVPYQFSIDLYQALLQQNAPVQLTSYPDYNHNSWDAAFAEPKFLSWLLTHQRKASVKTQ